MNLILSFSKWLTKSTGTICLKVHLCLGFVLITVPGTYTSCCRVFIINSKSEVLYFSFVFAQRIHVQRQSFYSMIANELFLFNMPHKIATELLDLSKGAAVTYIAALSLSQLGFL